MLNDGTFPRVPIRPPNPQCQAYNQSISLQNALFSGTPAQAPMAKSSTTHPVTSGVTFEDSLPPGVTFEDGLPPGGMRGHMAPWPGGNMVINNAVPHCPPSGYAPNIGTAPVLGPALVPNQLTLAPSPGPGTLGMMSMSPTRRQAEESRQARKQWYNVPLRGAQPQQTGDANHVVWGNVDLDSQDSMAPFFSGGVTPNTTPHNSTSGMRPRKKIQNRRVDGVLFLDDDNFSSAGTMVDDYNSSHQQAWGSTDGPLPNLPTLVREEGEVEDGHLRGSHFGIGECDDEEDEEDSDGDEQRQQQEEQMARQREFESQGIDIEALLEQVPRNEDGSLTSIGSIGHDQGQCKAPCVFAMRKRGCMNGTHCNFCHLHHKVKRQRQKHKARPRPCKGKRDRYRKHWEELKTQIEEAPEKFDPENVELPASISSYEKLKAKLVTRLKTHKSNVIAERAAEHTEPQN